MLLRQCNYVDVISLNLIFVIAQVREIKASKAALKLKNATFRIISHYLLARTDFASLRIYTHSCLYIGCISAILHPHYKYILQRNYLNYGNKMIQSRAYENLRHPI